MAESPEDIVRDMAAIPEQIRWVGGHYPTLLINNCPLCNTTVGHGEMDAHTAECPWRRSYEWVAENP